MGIPCIYYGTEQAFDGSEASYDPAIDPGFEDRFIREAMFGGSFGAFETAGCHFFDARHPAYQRIAAIARVRLRQDQIGLALRRGRQYQRETSISGAAFELPGAGELLAWSRIVHQQEVVVIINSHGTEDRSAEVTVDAALHRQGSTLTYLYRGDWSDSELQSPPQGQVARVEDRDGRAVVRIDLPAAGMALLA